MVHADYDAYVSMIKVPKLKNPFSPEGTLSSAFNSHGYYYGPIGTYRGIPNLENYKIVLQLRDPRDVLTSLFFSTAYSHAIINPKLLRRREQALKMSVDEFVLAEIEEYLLIYQQYCEQLVHRSDVLFLKYEGMVTDFERWLSQLSQWVGLDGEFKALNSIRKQADFNVSNEDIYAQRRQVTPGDYLRKLRPKTIQKLNSAFKPILKDLGYDI